MATEIAKGHCKHGEFELLKGCDKCITEYAEVNSPANIAKRIKETKEHQESKLQIVKVKYISEITGELSGREYTYYSIDPLKVGDTLTVPVRDSTAKAQVSAIVVPEAEIASFKDKVKTIPSGSVIPTIKVSPEQGEIEAEAREQKTMERLTGIGEEGDRSTDELEEGLNSEGLTLREAFELVPEDAEAKSILEKALILRPGEDIEVHSYFEEAMKLLKYAEGRVIRTLEDAKTATDDLSIISRLKKAMEAKRKEKLAPHEAQVKAIRDTYNYLMNPVLEAERITKVKQTAFIHEQERIQREQEEINRKRLEAAQSEMKLKGELTESVNLIEVIEAPERVRTNLGISGMVDHWVFEVVDILAVPREYLVIDSAMLNAIAKKHHDLKVVPGIKFINQPYIATRAK